MQDLFDQAHRDGRVRTPTPARFPMPSRKAFRSAVTRVTKPMSIADCAEILSPVNITCAARPMPMRRGRRCMTPLVSKSPRFTSANSNDAICDAMRMSLAIATSAPTPTATPLMAEMIGLGMFTMRRVSSCISFNSARACSIVIVPSNRCDTSSRSMPAENARPVARQQDHADGIVLLNFFEQVEQRLEHAAPKHIQHFGAVERDDGNLVLGFVEDVCHVFYFEDWDSGLTFSGISMKEACSPPSIISTLGLPVSGILAKVSLSAPERDTRNFHPRRSAPRWDSTRR
jgi:hypothetical protein